MTSFNSFAMIPAVVALLACTGAQAQDARRGEKIFESCRSCHAVDKDAPNPVGPSLHGVFGRPAGSHRDFRYSPAMRRSGITWDAKSLDAFIADPQKTVPANRMPFDGVPNARDRADLLSYMRQAFP